MSISMYTASVPVFTKTLGNMLTLARQGRGPCRGAQVRPGGLPDAAPGARHAALPAQIHIASDAAKGCVARLAGMEAPKFEDNETTLERVARAHPQDAGLPGHRCRAKDIDGSEERDIVIPRRNREPRRFKGEYYLKHFALPNFFFHATTLYALLRHNGVELGKADFLQAD